MSISDKFVASWDLTVRRRPAVIRSPHKGVLSVLSAVIKDLKQQREPIKAG